MSQRKNSEGWLTVEIDASGHCQLACPSCPTAGGLVSKALGAGHLSLERFRTLLDQTPSLARVELSNWGEMFLNPQLADIIRCAQERKVVLHADNGTNLNHVREEVLEALVKHRFRSLACSIDGASPETYSKYRVKGDFERVIGNIRKINDWKRHYNSGFPVLTWQFIVFGHNEHEIAAARKIAADLGMMFRAKLSWDDDFSPIRNRQLVQIQLRSQAVTREEHYRQSGVEYGRGICYQLWNGPVLNWDGRVTGCCRNFWGDFGANAFTDGLEASLNSEPMQYARKMLLGQADARPDIPCSTCDLFESMQRDKRWLTQDEVSRRSDPMFVSIAVDLGASEATHVDIFLVPGHEVNRALFVQPPPAQRYEVGKSFSVVFPVTTPGDFTIYALPKRLDPTYRKKYPPMNAVTLPITVEPRPLAQEFTITI